MAYEILKCVFLNSSNNCLRRMPISPHRNFVGPCPSRRFAKQAQVLEVTSLTLLSVQIQPVSGSPAREPGQPLATFWTPSARLHLTAAVLAPWLLCTATCLVSGCVASCTPSGGHIHVAGSPRH